VSRGRSSPGDAGRGGAQRTTPRARTWRDRLDDPGEPLFTMAIAADLLGLDVQALRRLGEAVDRDGARPSGNQRRYSRDDLEVLGRAADLAGEGHNTTAITRILELEQQVGDLHGRTLRS